VLLAVACQYLLAGAANLGPVCLRTAKNTQHVVGIDLQLGLAKPRHIWVAGGTFLIISLPRRRSDGRWLRRQLLRARNSYGQCEHQRQNGYPDHDPPFRAFGPSNVGNFYLTLIVDSLVGNFQVALPAVVRWASAAAACHGDRALFAGNASTQATKRSLAVGLKCPLPPESCRGVVKVGAYPESCRGYRWPARQLRARNGLMHRRKMRIKMDRPRLYALLLLVAPEGARAKVRKY